MKEVRILINAPKLEFKDGIPPYGSTVVVQSDNAWDAAHKYRETNELEEYVEPDIDNDLYDVEEPTKLLFKSTKAGYLQNWPAPPEIDDKFIWHLDDDYSELKKASNTVWNKVNAEKCIKIAHIDTGYQEGHPALPEHLNSGISFVEGEEGMAAIDKTKKTFAEQDGHGTATMSILAGKKIFYDKEGIKFEGNFGGIPFAEIIPIRISDTVALIRSQNFVKAVEYAIQQGCEVVSMSMAGAPTKAWAEVVNKAYENGVTLVTAAGNSWNKGAQRLLPKRLLYPARWDRVIAATGVTSNHMPYVFKAQITHKSEGGESMQGNYGPKKTMKSAIAAYTPNTPWATMNESKKGIYYRLDGGGTSSATPQVAAAVALWFSFHKKELDSLAVKDKWKRVEAVKYALFESADKQTYDQWEKYYGNGILKSERALQIFPDVPKLKKAKKAKTSLNGILDFLGIMIRVKSDAVPKNELNKDDMFTTEILQHLHTIPELHDYLDIDDNADGEEIEVWNENQKKKLKKVLLEAPQVSKHLKQKLESL